MALRHESHIEVDARTGITHSFTTTAANERDLNQANQLLHGQEAFVFADVGCRCVEKRDELKQHQADWHIAEQPGRLKALQQHPRINKVRIQTEYQYLCEN
jgi:IS5 family transposase